MALDLRLRGRLAMGNSAQHDRNCPNADVCPTVIGPYSRYAYPALAPENVTLAA